MPMERDRYPKNWEAIALKVKEEADWKCEECGKQCRRPGEPFDTHKRTLTVAHLNHTPEDCRRENLRALCAPCHLRYDAAHHADTRRKRREEKNGQTSLEEAMHTMYPNIKTVLDDGAYLPERAHATDAGADLRTPHSFTLPAHGNVTVNTGVHMELPPNTVGMIKSKSGLNVLHDIICTGVNDEGFTGEIRVRLHNLGDEPYRFERGDKICQVVVERVCYPSFEQVDEISGGERGSNGYGSTGR